MVEQTPVWTRDPELWFVPAAEHAVVGGYELVASDMPADDRHPEERLWEVFAGPTLLDLVATGTAPCFDEAKKAAERAWRRLASTPRAPVARGAELMGLFGEQIGRLIPGGPKSWEDGLVALARIAVTGDPADAQETLRAIVDATLQEAYGKTSVQMVLEENEKLLGDPWCHDAASEIVLTCPNCDRDSLAVVKERRSAAWVCDDCGWESNWWLRT